MTAARQAARLLAETTAEPSMQEQHNVSGRYHCASDIILKDTLEFVVDESSAALPEHSPTHLPCSVLTLPCKFGEKNPPPR